MCPEMCEKWQKGIEESRLTKSFSQEMQTCTNWFLLDFAEEVGSYYVACYLTSAIFAGTNM